MVSFAQQDPQMTCYKCGKSGHIAKHCPLKSKKSPSHRGSDDDSSLGSELEYFTQSSKSSAASKKKKKEPAKVGWQGFQF